MINNHKDIVIAILVPWHGLEVKGDVLPASFTNRQGVEQAWSLIAWHVRPVALMTIGNIRVYIRAEIDPIIVICQEPPGLHLAWVGRDRCGMSLLNEFHAELAHVWYYKLIPS